MGLPPLKPFDQPIDLGREHRGLAGNIAAQHHHDPELADPADLQGLMVIEKLVNDIVLDEREPGSFDPLARMRAKLAEDIRKARFHIREMEGHSARIERHIQRLQMQPGTDVLGYMLRARIAAIAKVIDEAGRQIAASTRASDMLEGYSYVLDEAPSRSSSGG